MSHSVPDKKGPWVAEEDAILIREKQAQMTRVETQQPTESGRPGQGSGWAAIAHHIPGRCAKQCRERWEQNLKSNLKKGEITADECRYIVNYVSMHGKKWADMARQLQVRSDNNVKNWYNGMLAKTKNKFHERPDNEIQAHFYRIHLAEEQKAKQHHQHPANQQGAVYSNSYEMSQAYGHYYPSPHNNHSSPGYSQPAAVYSNVGPAGFAHSYQPGPAPTLPSLSRDQSILQRGYSAEGPERDMRVLPRLEFAHSIYRPLGSIESGIRRRSTPSTPGLSTRGQTPSSTQGSPLTPASNHAPGFPFLPNPVAAGSRIQAETAQRSNLPQLAPLLAEVDLEARGPPPQNFIRGYSNDRNHFDDRGDAMEVCAPPPCPPQTQRRDPMALNSLIN